MKILLTSAAIGDNFNATGLSKLLSDGFKRFIYWSKYKVIDNILVEMTKNNEEKYIRELFDSSYQGVKRLFVLAYNNTAGDNQVSVDSFKKYFLPRFKIENYNIEIDGRNFSDQSIDDSIKQYDKIRKILHIYQILHSWTIKRNNAWIF